MSRTWNRTGVVLLALAVVLLFAACGGMRGAAQRNQRTNQLKSLGIMYHNYHDRNGKGPSRVEDLAQLGQDDPQTYAALQRGDFVLIWDVSIPGMVQGSSNTVLGYEAAAPTNGGLVLMGDGSVRSMTVAEFQAAPKAQPKPKK